MWRGSSLKQCWCIRGGVIGNLECEEEGEKLDRCCEDEESTEYELSNQEELRDEQTNETQFVREKMRSGRVARKN